MKIKKILVGVVVQVGLLLGTSNALAQEIVQYVHTDALGSPVAISDANGTVIERTVYEPYGAVVGDAKGDRPGFTGHVSDSATGLTQMQQRYYDSQLGAFLSVDPVQAYTNIVGAFNRYWYANNNPLRFKDPDGRRACGQDWDCRMSQQSGSLVSLSPAQSRAVEKNPQAYLDRLNSRKNSQGTEAGSARYFSNTAVPVTVITGLEVGADVAQVGDGFTVVNYQLGERVSWGKGSGAVIQGQSYMGPGVRVAIVHTHPVNTAFSYWKGSCWCYGKWEGSLYRGDLERARFAGVNSYVAGPSGGVIGFDFRRMVGDGGGKSSSYISAEQYFFEVP